MKLWALAACALMLGAAASQAPTGNQPADKGAQAKGADAKGGPPAPAPAPATVQEVVQAPATKPRAEGDGEKANGPNWAERGTFWTGVVQAVVGMLGLIGLFFTVLYARAAWKAAEKSAKAADDTLKATLQSEERQLRAYIFVDETVEHDFEVGKRPRVYVKFMNRGATPATDVIFRNKVELYPVDVAEEHLVPPELDDISSSPIAQGTGGAGDVTMIREMTQPLMDAYLKGEAMLVLTGVIEYTDIFGKRHESGYRMRKLITRSKGDLSVAPKGNYYT
ncbi:hypothetical protein [Phenylobacterium sp.]|uniref:hypothetical protein n=1 Tax=Phenylobacterium sp. TaxID=1871053 RepID=UPI003BA94871